MNRYLLFILIILGITIAMDVYLWYGLRATIKRKRFVLYRWFIPLTTFVLILSVGIQIYRISNGQFNSTTLLNLTFGASLGVFAAKILLSLLFLLEDIFRFSFFVKSKAIPNHKHKEPSFGRRKFVRNISLGLASVPLLGSIYAITKGKYNFHVKKLDLFLKRLPSSFNGLKVVQFSDFHSGSFDDIKKVEAGLALINEIEPDIILFTGDLVNNRSVEAHPYINLLKNLKAKYGKFAVLGNHDYGEYIPFDNVENQQKDRNEMIRNFKRIGFQLLRNKSIQIDNGKDHIDLIGVENWGKKPFPQYGDIDLAIKGLQEEQFNIVMSHDPDHWEYVLREHPKHFDLTLSGHTHGFQMGVQIPGWKWSPAQYRYKRWLGHYSVNQQHLFVSKGFGFLGFPGRIGMPPEIVSFRLYQDKT